MDSSTAARKVYGVQDRRIFWLNDRPFWNHGVLGTGGFATVYKMEMLVPCGLEVGRDADGGLIFNEEGQVAVLRSSSSQQVIEQEQSLEQCGARSTPPCGPPSHQEVVPVFGVEDVQECPAVLGRGEQDHSSRGSCSPGTNKNSDQHEAEAEGVVVQAEDVVWSNWTKTRNTSGPPASMSYFRLDEHEEHPPIGADNSPTSGTSSSGAPSAKCFFRVQSLSSGAGAGAETREEEDEESVSDQEDEDTSRSAEDEEDTSRSAEEDEEDHIFAGRVRTGSESAPVVVVTSAISFAITESNKLFSSGAFFALKIQAAKTKKQLTDFAREVESFRLLRGSVGAVQIRDHSLMWDSLHLVILMELGACDLLRFFKSAARPRGDGEKNALSVGKVSRIWTALLRAVDAAHCQDIIHRDLKPQNFLLVPVEPFADRILATTSTPVSKFQFRFLDEDRSGEATNGSAAGDEDDIIALALQDSSSGKEVVLRLVIKLADFGLAQPLELEESHLSVQGHAGTLKYMAPETVQPTTAVGLRRKLSKRVDIWALGMMLFQMLHDGRTPFDRFFKKGDIEAAVAIATKV